MSNISAKARTTRPLSDEQMSRAAFQAFFGITEDWGLTADEQNTLLGSLPRSSFYRLRASKSANATVDMLDRISYVMGIHKALRILLPDLNDVARWIHQPNKAPLFGGRSALEKMLSGHMQDLAELRRYLDAERG